MKGSMIVCLFFLLGCLIGFWCPHAIRYAQSFDVHIICFDVSGGHQYRQQ